MMIRHTIWNLLGDGLPMLAALASIPILAAGIGLDRFGALTLVWALLGYLMVLDFGLARSLIQMVAERRSRGAFEGIAGLAGTALGLMGGVGVVTGGALALASGALADQLVDAQGGLAAEVRNGLLVLAALMPVALVSAGLRGLLEAHHEFRRVNQIKIVMGTANYLSPLVVLPFTDSLVPVIAAIAVGRFVGMVAYGRFCLAVLPGLFLFARPREPLRPLFTMGAWTMLNNLLGPLMTYADRFVLASLVPVAAVAYYTIPFEIVSRLLFIPAALSGVLFPASAGLFRREPEALARILGLGGFATAAVFLAVEAGAALLGGPALRVWMGAEFAANGSLILAILALGILLNAIAYVPYALLHGLGRMDVTARLQLAEAPVYFGLLWILVTHWGPIGAAIAWAVRTGCDLLLLLVVLARLMPSTAGMGCRLGGLAFVAALVTGIGLGLGNAAGTVVLTGGIGVCLGVALWRLHVLRFAPPAGPASVAPREDMTTAV